MLSIFRLSTQNSEFHVCCSLGQLMGHSRSNANGTKFPKPIIIYCSKGWTRPTNIPLFHEEHSMNRIKSSKNSNIAVINRKLRISIENQLLNLQAVYARLIKMLNE